MQLTWALPFQLLRLCALAQAELSGVHNRETHPLHNAHHTPQQEDQKTQPLVLALNHANAQNSGFSQLNPIHTRGAAGSMQHMRPLLPEGLNLNHESLPEDSPYKRTLV